MEVESPNVVLLSGVLQFVENPFDILNELISYRIKYIIIDRTYVTDKDKDYLTIQNVPPQIYPASYPFWFFSERKLLDVFTKEYTQILSVDSCEKERIGMNDYDARSKCYIFRLKE
jgi:putative methyltransferase (TIGR04325 family)